MNVIKLQNKPCADTDIHQLETLIASIVEVTQQRDRVALEDCMSRVILQLTGAKSLTVFHLEPKDDQVHAVPVSHLVDGAPVSPRDAGIMPIALASHAALAAQLEAPYPDSPASANAETLNELILPLRGSKGQVSTFCRLESASIDANTQRVLILLLAFYSNFITLLDDNERDALTGLLNRKTFDMRISRILDTLRNQHARSSDKAGHKNFCIATLDIDHFKQVNDTFGHIYGDEVLLLFSELMKKTFRNNDLLFRFGGEEFVVLLEDTDFSQAHVALERFRSAVENHPFPRTGKITVSIGASLLSANEMPRNTIDRADQALYFAKQNGRNQIRVYEELVEQGLLARPEIQTGAIEMF